MFRHSWNFLRLFCTSLNLIVRILSTHAYVTHLYVQISIYRSATVLARLAKVFSQGKYYVGGPQKVSICRDCLFRNTLIMRFCLFIMLLIVVYRGISTALAIHSAYSLWRSQRESRLLLHSPNPIPLYVPKWSYWSKFKFRISHWPNLSF
jgi:hypothetical protein